jgi:autophagy-related protein 5
MQVPRYTYLPLLIPEIRENLVELALDDQAFGETNEKDWWFEEDTELGEGSFAPQGPCKWYVELRSLHLSSLVP